MESDFFSAEIVVRTYGLRSRMTRGTRDKLRITVRSDRAVLRGWHPFLSCEGLAARSTFGTSESRGNFERADDGCAGDPSGHRYPGMAGSGRIRERPCSG